jgi:hypothetical protein
VPSGWKVKLGSGNGPLGMADSGTKTITLWPRDHQSDNDLLFTLYHEVGHAYDFDRLNSSKRGQWANARGYSPDPWFGCNGCSDFDTPARLATSRMVGWLTDPPGAQARAGAAAVVILG